MRVVRRAVGGGLPASGVPCCSFSGFHAADEMVGGLSDSVYVAALSQHLCTVVFKVYCLPGADFMSHLRD